MAGKNLDNFFEQYLEKESLFLNKKVLQSSYTPDNIPHRGNEIKQIASVLAPALRLDRPSNIFLYGKTGTGKTLSITHTTNKILDVAGKNNIKLKVIYLNCKLKKVADTEYRLIAQLARDMGKEIPPTGLPTEEVYKIFFNVLDSQEQLILLVLDEIDQLVHKIGDEILYNLTRINAELKHSQICLVGISNDLMFVDKLDPRVRSSLSEEEILFPPYNAIQLQEILRERVSQAFKPESIGSGVIEKCSAYAAREHGDARRSLELLRVAGELAEREDAKVVTVTHIDSAEEKIEKDRVVDIVSTQPNQIQAVIYAMLTLQQKNQNVFTGEIYDTYRSLCAHIGLRPLTQRRISDIIAELDDLGIITAKVISKGRYGRTKEIALAFPETTEAKVRDLLQRELGMT